MGDGSPIGVLDSGVGGLSVLVHLRQLLPAEEAVYVADSAWCPYGPRPAEVVRERVVGVAGALLERGVKLVVVACNSASTVALAELRRAWPGVPFVGTEPAVKPAAVRTRTRAIGVLATATTARGEALARLIDRYGAALGVSVHVAVPDGLVELVERGTGDSGAAVGRLTPIMRAWRAAGVDVVVLGCTHYAFARRAIERAAGPGMALVDPGPAVARQAARLLAAGDALAPVGGAPGRTTYLTTGDPEAFGGVLERLPLVGPGRPFPFGAPPVRGLQIGPSGVAHSLGQMWR
jgi:glutamate racemase